MDFTNRLTVGSGVLALWVTEQVKFCQNVVTFYVVNELPHISTTFSRQIELGVRGWLRTISHRGNFQKTPRTDVLEPSWTQNWRKR